MRNAWRENSLGETGLTLPEILIALSIIGVLAMVAIPNFLDWLPRYQLHGQARELYSHMQSARLRAITANERHGITVVNDHAYCLVPSPTTNICASQQCCLPNQNPTTLCYTDPAKACTPHQLTSGIVFGAAPGTQGPPSNPSTDVEADGVAFPNNRVSFSSDGSSPDNGALYLKNGLDDTFAVTVLNTTGRIRLWRLSKGTTNGWR